MALKMIPADEAIYTENLIILVYGDPGVGKTSLACTAKNPILLDFDNGSHRSAFRKMTARVECWDDVGEIKAFVSGYDTLIIDTVGTAMDFLIRSLPDKEGKSAANKRADGTLTVAGYGTLKNRFEAWAKTLRAMKKDIIFVAHAKEKGSGDEKIIRPDIVGGSYDIIVRQCDFAGYHYSMGKEAKRGVLDFSPTDEHIGKNSANFPKITVPDFMDEPDFFAVKIAEMKAAINSLSEAQKSAVALLQSIESGASEAETPERFNEIWAIAKEKIGENKSLRLQVWAKITAKLPEGIIINKEKGCFDFAPNKEKADENLGNMA